MFLSSECLIRRCHTGFSPKCVLSFYTTKHINSVFSFGSVLLKLLVWKCTLGLKLISQCGIAPEISGLFQSWPCGWSP